MKCASLVHNIKTTNTPHIRLARSAQRAIRRVLAEMFIVDEEDTKLVSFNQKMEKPVQSDLVPKLMLAQHKLKAFVTVQGLPPTSKFHTVQNSIDPNTNQNSTMHHYFEWMEIRTYYIRQKEMSKTSRKIGGGGSGAGGE